MITAEDFKEAAEVAFHECCKKYGQIYPNFCDFFTHECSGDITSIWCIRTDFRLPCNIDNGGNWGEGLEGYDIPRDAVIVMETLENGRVAIRSKIRPVVTSHDAIWHIALGEWPHSAELKFGPDARPSALTSYITNLVSVFVRYVHDALLVHIIADCGNDKWAVAGSHSF